MNPNIDDLFTAQSLLTLQGSAAACYIVPNVLGRLVKAMSDITRARIAFVLALIIQLLVTSQVDEKTLVTWLVGLMNAFLVAASALGINEFTSGRPGPPGPGGPRDNTTVAPETSETGDRSNKVTVPDESAERRPNSQAFLTSWLH